MGEAQRQQQQLTAIGEALDALLRRASRIAERTFDKL
jgi:hypothetical protein